MTALLLLAMLAPARTTGEEFTLPTVERGDVRATLAIRVAEQTPMPGSARVRFRVTVEGPADLRLGEPILEDALSAWRVPIRTSSWVINARLHWEYTLTLVQTKPGVVPLPGIRLRFASGDSAEEEITWPDPLLEPADVAPLVEPSPLPPSPWPQRLLVAALVALGVSLMVALLWLGRRWLRRPARPLSPAALALAEMDQVSHEPAGNRIGKLDGIIRGYLETLGIPARRTTTAELLRLVAPLTWMSQDTRELLGLFLRRCEEDKFAPLEETPEAVEERIGQARQIVNVLAREAAQARQGSGEGRPAQENGRNSTTGIKSAV